jgi:S-adenosylmethionine:tRNA ribosyltransferase-isomerase
MDLSEFKYELPQSLIAAYPSRERQASRLLVVRRSTGEIIHSVFSNLQAFLDSGDLLVLNDAKVFPARLHGTKESGGRVDALLVERFPCEPAVWMALLDSAKKPRVGSRIVFGEELVAEVIGDMGRGRFGLQFQHRGDFLDQLEKWGEPPLPPYIRRRRSAAPSDRDRYQTVYAAKPGAVAAPTAGLHFTPGLLSQLKENGIDTAVLTLYVGPGTFQPVRETEIEKHRMEGERYSLSAEAAEKVSRVKRSGRRVVAVGSTSTRVLEWVALQRGKLEAGEGIARLYIRPGDGFHIIDALITNFHLPGSTPLILVAAFAGLDLMRRAYAEAIKMKYRFYSYGDAMLIL